MQSPQIKMLERFVLRARIVQDHSLARDIGMLRNLASHEIKMIVTRNLKTGETGLEMKPVDLLPTEQLESAAAESACPSNCTWQLGQRHKRLASESGPLCGIPNGRICAASEYRPAAVSSVKPQIWHISEYKLFTAWATA